MDIGSKPILTRRSSKREYLFGNLDTWLIWNLTGGVHGGFTTRMCQMLAYDDLDIHTLQMDERLLAY
jgi:glycerol kinase